MIGAFMGLFYSVGRRDMLLHLLTVDLFGTNTAWNRLRFRKNGAYLGAAVLAFNQADKNRHSALLAYLRYRRHTENLVRGLSNKRGLILLV